MIVDAADYFVAIKQGMLQARQSIMLIGWDFDTSIAFEPDGATVDGPNTLGDFLDWLATRDESLRIRVLQWDLGTLEALSRLEMPEVLAPWTGRKNVQFKLDSLHPAGAAHHSKVAVIDDALAFCGGIDMTAERWDTSEHRDGDRRRFTSGGSSYQPWHDATTAVAGPLARDLGEHARLRWLSATDEVLEPASPREDIWPQSLEPTFQSVDVAVMRTFPKHSAWKEVREIESFYLDAIAAAEQAIYFESQYFASRRIAEAIADRLLETDGPEVVIVMPQHGEGWLRRKAMDGARAKLLHLCWQADGSERFRVYYPTTERGKPIYVHAKITIIDDRILRVGSSNLNNRSMGFDTECDLALDAVQSNGPDVRRRIARVRSGLLCEHLNRSCATFDDTFKARGSLIGTIEQLRSDTGRSLRKLSPDMIEDDDSALAENDLTDPERYDGLVNHLRSGLRQIARR
ncbi:MAG: phospholipase D-like domain-containing protein [Pseudomonadota bacterium]